MRVAELLLKELGVCLAGRRVQEGAIPMGTSSYRAVDALFLVTRSQGRFSPVELVSHDQKA